MTPDRERIEREARELVEHWVSATPLRVSMTDQTYLSSAIMSLVLRERAAAWDAARKVLERVDPRFPTPDGGYGIDWSGAIEDALKEMTALAAQERA